MTVKPERDRQLGLSLKSFVLFLLLSCGWLCSAESQTVTITKGGTYAGYGFAASGVGIAIETTEPVIIELSTVGAYCAITNVVNGVYYPGINVTIKDCYLYSTSPTNDGTANTILCFLWEPASVNIVNCSINGQVTTQGGLAAGGIVIWGSGSTSTAPITVCNSTFWDNSPAIQIADILNDPSINLYDNQIGQSVDYQHSDQINIYNSCGTPGHLINIQQNCVVSNPDAPQFDASTGIQAGDLNDSYVQVVSNIVINGQGGGLGAYYANNNTDVFNDNTVVGLGYSLGITAGIGVWAKAGTVKGNSCVWGNFNSKFLAYSYYPKASYPGNTTLPESDLTLAYEQSLYQQWLDLMATDGVSIGYLTNPGVTFPKKSDFP